MPPKFITVLWDTEPHDFDTLKNGVRVNLDIRQVSVADGDGTVTKWRSRSCVMSAPEFAAYLGARSVAAKREQEIVDETVLNLINEGSL